MGVHALSFFSGELEVCLRDAGLCDLRSRDHPKDFRDAMVSRPLHHQGDENFLVYVLVEASRKFAGQLASPREYALLGRCLRVEFRDLHLREDAMDK